MKLRTMFERETIDLSGFWYFKADPDRSGEREGWIQASTLDWDRLYVPASWNEQCSDYTWYMGVAWYARDFHVPKDWDENIVLLNFEGVNYKAKVWVNGNLAGEHEGGFTPFSFRVEHALRFGEKNRVVVMVDNSFPRRPYLRATR